MNDTKLLIDGTWRAGSSGAEFEVENPATGAMVAHASQATPQIPRKQLSVLLDPSRSGAKRTHGRAVPRCGQRQCACVLQPQRLHA